MSADDRALVGLMRTSKRAACIFHNNTPHYIWIFRFFLERSSAPLLICQPILGLSCCYKWLTIWPKNQKEKCSSVGVRVCALWRAYSKKSKKRQRAEESSLRAVGSALIASHPPPLTPSKSERGGRVRGLRVWIREVLHLGEGGGGEEKNTHMNGYRWGCAPDRQVRQIIYI